MGRSAVLSRKPNPHLSQNWRNSSNVERPICKSTVHPTASIAYLQLRGNCAGFNYSTEGSGLICAILTGLLH